MTEAASENSSTRLDRPRRKEDAPLVPALILLGSAEGIFSETAGQVTTFGTSLQVGRRTPAPSEAEQGWVLDDGLLSKRHFSIRRQDDEFEVVDLGSRNGTLVDGVRAKVQPIRLREGAVIFAGGQVFVFRMVTQAEKEAIERERERPFGPVRTGSPMLAMICAKLRRLAPSQREILLTGETGVGKDVFARAIHQLSGRPGPFVAINCAALPRELMESEIFGYARGAHSQARESKTGLFETAEGGTIFLDEIGELPPELQAKLLRFLQDREVMPLGAVKARKVDVRVLAATNRVAAPTDVSSLGLRADLAMRLGPEPVKLPSLRQRIEDLGVLVAHFLGAGPWRFEPVALQALALHRWPGNIRELQKVIEDAKLLVESGSLIGLEALPLSLVSSQERLRTTGGGGASRPPPSADELEQTLRKCGGNISQAARILGRQPALLYRWCHRYNLDPEHFREKTT